MWYLGALSQVEIPVIKGNADFPGGAIDLGTEWTIGTQIAHEVLEATRGSLVIIEDSGIKTDIAITIIDGAINILKSRGTSVQIDRRGDTSSQNYHQSPENNGTNVLPHRSYRW